MISENKQGKKAKTKEKVFINIYCDSRFKAMFEAAAKAEGMSVSELGGRFLRAAMKARYGKKPRGVK